jgi:hypothetical protein
MQQRKLVGAIGLLVTETVFLALVVSGDSALEILMSVTMRQTIVPRSTQVEGIDASRESKITIQQAATGSGRLHDQTDRFQYSKESQVISVKLEVRRAWFGR